MPARVATHSESERNTCATLPVIVARSTCIGGRLVASPTRKRTSPAPGFDRVRIAGEPERETRERRLAAGIPVDATTWEEILAAGEKVGVPRADTMRAAGLA